VTRFETHADSYEAAVDESIAFAGQGVVYFARRKAHALLEVCKRRFGDPGKLSILDAGCGIGITDEHLIDDVRELHGVDISAASIEQAAARNPAVKYQVCEPHRLPFEADRFDAALAACVFHHVPPDDRTTFATELARVVRPGGIVIVFEHNPLNPLTRVAVSRCEFDDDAILLRRREMSRVLESGGLVADEHRFIVFFPRGGARVEAAERFLGRVPLGAQYYVVGTKRLRSIL
jgi:SAM-dependent methyltransferase